MYNITIKINESFVIGRMNSTYKPHVLLKSVLKRKFEENEPKEKPKTCSDTRDRIKTTLGRI